LSIGHWRRAQRGKALVGRNRAQRSPDRGRFTRADVDILLKAAWGEYAARLVKLLSEELARLTEEHDALLKK
jgi:hypothetical protein